MIHQCKIYDPKGNLKQVLSSENLTKEFWHDYEKNSGVDNTLLKKLRNSRPDVAPAPARKPKQETPKIPQAKYKYILPVFSKGKIVYRTPLRHSVDGKLKNLYCGTFANEVAAAQAVAEKLKRPLDSLLKTNPNHVRKQSKTGYKYVYYRAAGKSHYIAKPVAISLGYFATPELAAQKAADYLGVNVASLKINSPPS